MEDGAQASAASGRAQDPCNSKGMEDNKRPSNENRSSDSLTVSEQGPGRRNTRYTTATARTTSRSRPSDYPWPRSAVLTIIHTKFFDAAILCVVLANTIATVLEADARAADRDTSLYAGFNVGFLVFYMFEMAFRMYGLRTSYFFNGLNLLDCTIVALDLILIILEPIFGNQPSFTVFRILRASRVLRMIRASRVFRELWLMLHGLGAALKAMLWACVVISMVLLIWSVVAVDLMHDRLLTMEEQGICTECAVLFSSVSQAMYTWFLLIFIGEQWVQMAVPLMLEYKAIAFVFLSAYVTVNLGLLNLILTVIVDRATEARFEDEHQKVEDKKKELEHAKQKLMKMCQEMDVDGSGTLDLREICEAYDQPEGIFRDAIRVMDLDRGDLELVFRILDENKDGTVTHAEFCEQLHKMKTQESQALLAFIKYYVSDIDTKVSTQLRLLKESLLVKALEQEKDIKQLLALSGQTNLSV